MTEQLTNALQRRPSSQSWWSAAAEAAILLLVGFSETRPHRYQPVSPPASTSAASIWSLQVRIFRRRIIGRGQTLVFLLSWLQTSFQEDVLLGRIKMPRYVDIVNSFVTSTTMLIFVWRRICCWLVNLIWLGCSSKAAVTARCGSKSRRYKHGTCNNIGC